MWNRPEVDYLDSTVLSWKLAEAGTLAGCQGDGASKLLSRDQEVGANTSLLRFRSAQSGRLDSAADLLVLSGAGSCNGRSYAAGDFMHVSAGSDLHIDPEVGETVLYAAFFGANRLVAAGAAKSDDGVEFLPTESREWTSMTWRGDRTDSDGPGARIQWLRQDDDGIAFLVAMLPGWSSDAVETHPVYEESYKIAGDLLMGRRGIVRTGGYFYRHPERPHGPLYTRDGSLSIIRKNGLGSTAYEAPVGTSELMPLVDGFYGVQSQFTDWEGL